MGCKKKKPKALHGLPPFKKMSFSENSRFLDTEKGDLIKRDFKS